MSHRLVEKITDTSFGSSVASDIEDREEAMPRAVSGTEEEEK